MNRLGLVLICCALLGACTMVDVGVGRNVDAWSWEAGANAYAEIGWPTNDNLLNLEIFGGPNAGTLISADIWRLLHLEIGLLGVGIGLGPLQIGAGAGFYAPHAPEAIVGDNPF